MATGSYDLLDLECVGPVATITLNRSDRLNAINPQLRRDLHAALEEVGANDHIRCVILTGAGRGFCAGADVRQMAGPRENPAQPQPPPSQVPFPVVIRALPQPVIAAVNGVAAGMGLSIALACDIRIASEEARFSSVFIKRSIVPDNGATYTLSRQVSPGIAAEMALTGRIYDARWALRVGLVNEVVPAEKLLEEAQTLASEIAANPPLGVRVTKQLLYRNDELQAQVDRESAGNAFLAGTEDRQEAIRSFLEKRQPIFKGR